MPYLYLVRHAQPDFAGNYDSVTDLGLTQSRWLGRHFAERGTHFARAACGSLQRQLGTLDALLGQLGQPPPRRTDPGFNEYDTASVLGAIAAGDDLALRAAGDRRAYFLALRSGLEAWSRRDAPVPGGETWRQFGERVDAAVSSACAGLGADEPVLVVTSGGVIGRLVADTLGAGADAAIELNLQTRNTGITEIACGRRARRVVSFNAVPHLERADRAHAVTHS
jgi:broad specificity phosphatase PhoE